MEDVLIAGQKVS